MNLKQSTRALALILILGWLLVAAACSKDAPPPQPPSPATATTQPPPEPPPVEPAEQAPVPAATAPATPAVAPDKPPAPEPKPAETAKTTAPAATATETAKPVSAEPQKPEASAHAAVGSEKCKMCHKVQYESWAASKHATASPKTECESCHGNGADYAKMSIMKDRPQALAAGLVLPDKAACARCHKGGRTDAQFQGVHAHKAK